MNKTEQKQKRVENILLSLSKLDYLSRSQLQKLHDLKGDRNANRFLNSMSEYVNSFRYNLEKVYYLSKKGREYIKCDVVRSKTQNIGHFLLRNQFYIYLKQPKTWKNETKIKLDALNLSIICDASFNSNGMPVFVEIDNAQAMSVNKQKIDKYKKLQAATDQEFILVWVTAIESRKSKLIELSKGLKNRVYSAAEIK